MPADPRCPVCSRPVAAGPDARPATFPFCSPRCRDRDLGAWLNGAYAVAGEEPTGDGGYPGERMSDRDRP
jgi:endogenous inhibitor of DNA gyrase (YacG/DUF329 family)